ncbi:LemA family protein [Planctomycetota bacterium]
MLATPIIWPSVPVAAALEWPAIVVPAVLGIGCVLLLYFGVRCLRRKRLIENVPTSKVEGVFIGLTEVKGQTESPSPMISYLAEVEAVYYRFDVQEQWRRVETYTDNEGKTRTRTRSGWTTVRSDEIRRPFFCRDRTGAIRVNPDNADIQADCVFSRTCGRYDPVYYLKGPHYSISNSTHRRRFTEHAVRTGQSVYIMGNAKLREDVLEPEIRYDPDDEMYLISTGSEEDIVRSYGVKAVACLMFGCLFGLSVPLGYHMVRFGSPFGSAVGAVWPFMVAIFVLYGLSVSALYLQLVYNGLIEVKNRMAQAWSLIDIQLKRRHDLIPNLVAVVKKLAGHERDVQEGLAKIRTEGFRGRGAPGIPDELIAMGLAGVADEQTAVLTDLFTYVERYPQLKADEGFLKLHGELARTERKISLARTFYNESVTAHNDRIHTMPDVLIAAPLGHKPCPHWKIKEFERQPVQVTFEEKHEDIQEPRDFEKDPLPKGAVALSEEEIAAAARERSD